MAQNEFTDPRSRDQYPVDDDQDGSFENIDSDDDAISEDDFLTFGDIPPDGDPADGYENDWPPPAEATSGEAAPDAAGVADDVTGAGTVDSRASSNQGKGAIADRTDIPGASDNPAPGGNSRLDRDNRLNGGDRSTGA